MQRELRAVDPSVAIEHVKTLEQIRSDSVALRAFAMRLLVGFSLVASALALVGIYGVLSLSVGSRKRELALRVKMPPDRKNGAMGEPISQISSTTSRTTYRRMRPK